MSITATKRKKDGLTQYRVRVPIKMEDGSFKYKERSVYGLQAAKDAERELRAAPVESDSTLNDLIALYMESRKGQVRLISDVKVNSHLNTHIIPPLGDVKLSALTPARLQKWKNEMSAKPISVVTKNNVYATFTALLNFGVKMDALQRNNLKTLGPFKDLEFTETKRFRYYTAEQFKTYIAAMPKSTLEERGVNVFFMTAFYTGARKGEINALKWTDIDGSILHIRRSVSQRVTGIACVETAPKNKSSYRDIQIPKPLLDCLAEHHAFCAQFKGFSDNWRVCGGPDIIFDHRLNRENIKCAKRAGLPHISIHEFRHSHATLLINAGVNIKEISRRLGHATVEMTWNVYSHLYPDQEQKAIEILNAL